MRATQVSRIARSVGASPDGLTRRRFVEMALATGAALMLPEAAFGKAGSKKPRVLVIGAGFAGLSCAWQLKRAGAEVTVLESRSRFGGRVLTLDNFIDNALVEAGAELIGSNHPTWMQYAKRFGLRMRDVTEDEDAEAPIILDGRRIAGPELDNLWEELYGALSLMNADARKVDLREPWSGEAAENLDHTSLAAAAAGWDVSETVRHAALTLLANDNAMRPDRTSYLGTLTAIAGGGYERFWTESEVYRCAEGNQTLAFKLAEAIGGGIQLGCAVEEIQLRSGSASAKDTKGNLHEADCIVLTVPPPAWRNFKVDPPIPAGYAPSAGPAVKYLSKVSSAFWEDAGMAPDSLTDTAIGLTWDGTDGQRKDGSGPACLMVFSGGKAAEQCLGFSPAGRSKEFSKRLEEIYPGYNEAFEKGIFMGWPEEKWTRCGYASPALGEVTAIYPKFETPLHDRLYFAGEYTSLDFTGFMEGALKTGATTAGKIAKSLNLV